LPERVLIVGAGFLGSYLSQEFKDHIIMQTNLTKIQNDSYMLNISDRKKVIECFNKFKPTIVINCAAKTNVDFLEKNPSIAYSINGESVRNIAIAAENHNARFIHISSDGIFDGIEGNYVEEDKPNPINVYARSKLIGEENVVTNCTNHIIVRTNFYGYNPQQKFLFNNILSKLKNGEQIIGFDDVIFTPLEVSNLSQLILDITFSQYNGILNLSSNESISKYKFCCKIAEVFDLDSNLIKKGSVEDMKSITKRPKNTSLINLKSKQFTKSKILSFDEGLSKTQDFV
jgi:dTDP-4-dehydrorhamnose reductase